MMKYRSKSRVIEPVRVHNGRACLPLPLWFLRAIENQKTSVDPEINQLMVRTPNGWIGVGTEGWILPDVNGDPYPCSDDVFEASYEPVEESRMPSGPNETARQELDKGKRDG